MTVLHSRSFVSDAVNLIARESESAIAGRGIFRIALSGGNTPRPIYEALATAGLPWDKWEITFSDERCVPPDSDQSNYKMAKLSLFDHAAIPAANILRMEGERDPEVAAENYERELLARSKPCRHDLILLGMGDDGHTASLFPGTEALRVTDRLVVANFVPKFSAWRITFTYPLLNAARHVCFLVSSAGKDPVLEGVFSGSSDYPSAAVAPADGNVTWLLGGGA
ncbi:MAG: 6-phosphogluconolactonase [Verrucomicrobiae bacterium]